MIYIGKNIKEAIEQHGKEAYPEECCGALLGNLEKDEKKCVKVIKIENQSLENKHRRFAITPQDYLKIEKQAKKEKMNLLGFYHTHPDHPAQPSETDLKFAWPLFSYIILSIEKGKAKELNSFILNENKKQLIQESIELN